MKAVFLSLLFLSVVVCNPFHLKDEQQPGKYCIFVSVSDIVLVVQWSWTFKYARDIQVSNQKAQNNCLTESWLI